MVWYSSDFHIGHHNIIKYCNRPFANVDEMNAYIYFLLKNVEYGDKVIHLGDLVFKGKTEAISEIEHTGVELVNIKGNHDEKLPFTIGNCLLKYNFCGQNVVLFEHKPSNECHHKNIFKALGIKVCVCGHVHNNENWKFSDKLYAAYDQELDVVNVNIGLDCCNYKLLSETELQNLITYALANKDKLPKVFEYRDETGRHV